MVRGFDRSHILIRARNVRTFQNQTTSDIVSKVVSEAGFSAQCDSTSDVHEFMQQDNETDWDFIWRLAERVGFEFVVEDKVAHFRKPTADNPVALQWPETLRSFSPRVTATQQANQVTLAAHDPKTKSVIDVTASSPNQVARIGVERSTVAGAFDGADVHIATEPVKSQSEGTAVAQALLDKLANGYIAAEGVSDGNPGIRAGTSVQVTGLGEKYSGTVPRRRRRPTSCAAARPTRRASPTPPRTRCWGRSAATGPAAALAPRSAPSSCSESSPTTTIPTTWAACA